MDKKIEESRRIINQALSEYDVNAIFVGFSGGGDSLLAANVAKTILGDKVDMFHANTGIGIEKTRKFVRNTCKDRDWNLVEIRAKEDCGMDYDEIVCKYGFPDAPQHIRMYIQLKERPIMELHRRYKGKRGGKIMILTGIRHDESRIRAGYANDVIKKQGGIIWANHVYHFSQQDKYDYLKQNNIKTNPVNDILGMSGECLCGAYAHKGELDLVGLIEPETRDRILALEERVKEHGFTWGWEDSMPKYFKALKEGQTDMFFDWENSDHFRPFCIGCGKTDGENNE